MDITYSVTRIDARGNVFGREVCRKVGSQDKVYPKYPPEEFLHHVGDIDLPTVVGEVVTIHDIEAP